MVGSHLLYLGSNVTLVSLGIKIGIKVVPLGSSETEKGKYYCMVDIILWIFFVNVTLLWKAGYGILIV